MKPIKNYPNYLVCDDGKIFSKYKNIFLKPGITKNGYNVVALSNEYGAKTYSVHRLVADAYIPNELNKPQINHKNGVKTDNKVDNLEWCTNKENQIHAHSIGIKSVSDRHKDMISVANSKPVIDVESGVFYESVKELSELLGIRYGTMTAYVSGRRDKITRYKFA